MPQSLRRAIFPSIVASHNIIAYFFGSYLYSRSAWPIFVAHFHCISLLQRNGSFFARGEFCLNRFGGQFFQALLHRGSSFEYFWLKFCLRRGQNIYVIGAGRIFSSIVASHIIIAYFIKIHEVAPRAKEKPGRSTAAVSSLSIK